MNTSLTPRQKKFRVMIRKMTQDLRKRMEAQMEKIQKMFNKILV